MGRVRPADQPVHTDDLDSSTPGAPILLGELHQAVAQIVIDHRHVTPDVQVHVRGIFGDARQLAIEERRVEADQRPVEMQMISLGSQPGDVTTTGGV